MNGKPKILCMFSGGLDSTGLLWNILHDEKYLDYDILVHHVHIVNATNRFSAEKTAVDKIISFFECYVSRKIYYSSTVIDFAFLGTNVPIDANLYGFVAANLVNIDLSIRYIAIGRTLDDKMSGGDELIQLVNCINDALYVCNLTRPNKSSASCLTPIVEMSKQQIWNMLPSDLRNATWSCRTPVYHRNDNGELIASPCKTCHACESIRQLK